MKFYKVFFIILMYCSYALSNDEAIINLFDLYSRPFTTLILDNGELELKNIMKSYPESVFITLQDESCSEVAYNLPNSIVLDKCCTLKNLVRISECEHFDVILALDNYSEMNEEEWQERLNILLSMADHVIMQAFTPLRQEYCLTKGGKLLENKNNKILYLFSNKDWVMRRKTWLMPLLEKPTHTVTSNFKQKLLHKEIKGMYFCSNWSPGINLVTFKMCKGSYPSTSTLKELLQSMSLIPHSDWMINNMILQGNKICMIDNDEPRYDSTAPIDGNSKVLEVHYLLMDIEDPVKIEHYFWNYLIRISNPLMRDKNFFIKELVQENDLVFDFGSSGGDNALLCLSHHCTVVTVEKSSKKIPLLRQLFDGNDYITMLHKKIVSDKVVYDNHITLQEMIDTYGKPDYCRVNVLNSHSLVMSLKAPIRCLSFPFAMTRLHELQEALEHLTNLGYQEFKFSSRSIPKYTTKEWLDSKVLLDKIISFAQKDHEQDDWWGFVHARIASLQ